MQAISPGDIESSLTTDGSTVAEITESFTEAIDAPEAVTEPFAELVNGLATALEETKERARDAEERVDELEEELKEEREARAKESAEDRQRIHQAEQRLDSMEPASGDKTPTPEAKQSTSQTPLERVCALPEHVAGDNLTANQERARFVAKGVRDYGRRVPAGIGIRSSEIRRVLSASEESSVHTQTVSRVMNFLAELGGDDVRLKTTRSGERTVVFGEEIVERITHVVIDEDGPPVIEGAI